MIYFIFFPFKMPSQNDLKATTRAALIGKIKDVQQKARAVIEVPPGVSKPIIREKVYLYLHRFYDGKVERVYDDGNIIGGFKPILDVFVREGWLADDKPAYIEHGRVYQYKNPKIPSAKARFGAAFVTEGLHPIVKDWDTNRWLNVCRSAVSIQYSTDD